MTATQYQDNLNKLLNAASNRQNEVIIVPAAYRLLGNIKNRIMHDGKNSNGGKIGDYSTKPNYYSRDQFVNKGSFKPQGKTSEKKFKNGSQHKSMFLTYGYRQLRNIQGMESSFKNYTYSGSFMNSYELSAQEEAVLLGLTKGKSAKIRQGLERKDGDVLHATNDELEAYNIEVQKSLKLFTLSNLSGNV